jgi:hypothetical protein
VFKHLANRLIAKSERRSPDFIVGGADNPYLRRWWLIPRNRFFNVYLHQFLRSDDDRALHDHPWVNASILLRGSYLECLPNGRTELRKTGSIIIRRATARHRIELIEIIDWDEEWIDGEWKWRPHMSGQVYPVWTLFITGPKLRDWGFHCPQGFVPWQDFTAPGAPGEVGKGCEQ